MFALGSALSVSIILDKVVLPNSADSAPQNNSIKFSKSIRFFSIVLGRRREEVLFLQE
jgi:hypothetical protein